MGRANGQENRKMNPEGEARMDAQAAIERRQQRRADVKAQIVLRSLDAKPEVEDGVIGRIVNVSLNGAYAMVPAPVSLKAGSSIAFSVSIPQEASRQFPFVRLLGKGWIIRIDKHPDGQPHRRKAAHAHSKESSTSLNLQDVLGSGEEAGVAIAFTRNVTALGAVGANYQ
jgi:hypothetical protein